ncbi:peptidoglycan DD-metalloendopeptidase family protein [bacterium]|nr:peptidoglycan DD-metalloendopeptidase family protein [bacterium]
MVKTTVIILALFLVLASNTHATEWEPTTLTNKRISAIEHTPWGIFGGEFDSYPPNNPYNGIFFSNDLGTTWVESGLQDRGITDLEYSDGNLYAAAYYNIRGQLGLWATYNKGADWVYIGNGFSLKAVSVDENTIYIGGTNHGVWISRNEGTTWTQKIGTGWYGPEVFAIQSDVHTTVAATTNETYISRDSGESWEKIDFLDNKNIGQLYMKNNDVLAGSRSPNGMYISNDAGYTWAEIPYFESQVVTSITNIHDQIVVSTRNQTATERKLHISLDNGQTWTQINDQIPGMVADMITIYAEPPKLAFSLRNLGVYLYEPQIPPPTQFPFMQTPWDSQAESELTDRITAYFDHQYPLLGYGPFSEPQSARQTTVNFLGISESPPKMYYSSHNGTDYSLLYGTQIVAASDGWAQYYYCKTCGHTIKVTHTNGYQTIYMHLQHDGLVTTAGLVWVETGEPIGKVGMTGNTDGPHLHFTVKKDNTVTDPYGWQTNTYIDPWSQFESENILGTTSAYLWELDTQKNTQTITEPEQEIASANKTVTPNQTNIVTILLADYIKPYAVAGLEYIKNSSLVVSAMDLVGNYIVTLDSPATIQIDFSGEDLTNIIGTTIKIYFWDSNTTTWEVLPTTLDLIDHKAAAETDHFSWFALLGEKIDKETPQTEIIVQENIVEFTVFDPDSTKVTTFYTIDSEKTWLVYENPFVLDQEGITNILFRSQDESGNLEETRNRVVIINTSGMWMDKAAVKGANFNLGSWN